MPVNYCKVSGMKAQDYYLAQELADKLRVNVMTIYRYIKAGKIKACKFGKEFRIERREFDRFTKQSVI
jgi:excisionase family DNA binding protein